jgi:hypothetical protein
MTVRASQMPRTARDTIGMHDEEQLIIEYLRREGGPVKLWTMLNEISRREWRKYKRFHRAERIKLMPVITRMIYEHKILHERRTHLVVLNRAFYR